MKPPKIRAHHLLCVQGFKGLGYDEKFVENFAKIADKIKNDPALEIIPADECDDICASCPKNEKGVCENPGREGKIRKMDRAVLRRAGLEKGKTTLARDALKSVNREIRGAAALEICENCQWKKDCLWFQSNL